MATGIRPRYRPESPSVATTLDAVCHAEVEDLAAVATRPSIIFVLIFSPGVKTVALSATPAQTPANIVPNAETFPVSASRGNRALTVSNVTNRTADFALFEKQKAPAPVYIGRMPLCRKALNRISIGEAGWRALDASCCFVFTNSVGYYPDGRLVLRIH
jgi:hypothetical protein